MFSLPPSLPPILLSPQINLSSVEEVHHQSPLTLTPPSLPMAIETQPDTLTNPLGMCLSLDCCYCTLHYVCILHACVCTVEAPITDTVEKPLYNGHTLRSHTSNQYILTSEERTNLQNSWSVNNSLHLCLYSSPDTLLLWASLPPGATTPRPEGGPPQGPEKKSWERSPRCPTAAPEWWT